MFSHKCGSNAFANLTGSARFLAKSMSISPHGVSYGVVELSMDETGKSKLEFVCPKCGDIPVEEVTCCCLVCRKNKPMSEIVTTELIPYLCTDCLKALQSKNPSAEISPEVSSVKEYLELPETFKFMPIMTAISKLK